MEWAAALEAPAGMFQLDVPADDADDVDAIANVLDGSFGNPTQEPLDSIPLTIIVELGGSVQHQRSTLRIFFSARLRAAAAFFFFRMLGLS